jgi:acylphosphatase
VQELRAVVRGVVQGIGFRAAVKAQAERADLNGQVRNLKDGGVEVIVQGPRDDLETLVQWLRQESPAQVSSVESSYGPVQKELQGFEIVP